MSYVIFGGLFDPPHLGHLEIATEAYRKIRPRVVIWVPSKAPPHRRVYELSADERFKILKYWLKGRKEFTVSDIELDDNHSGYSIETVEKFRKKYPREKSYFLIGSDEAEKFRSWKDWQKILSLTTLVIGRRKEVSVIHGKVKEEAVLLNNRIFPVSSTGVRERLRRGEPLEGVLDKKIVEYIRKRDLYQ